MARFRDSGTRCAVDKAAPLSLIGIAQLAALCLSLLMPGCERQEISSLPHTRTDISSVAQANSAASGTKQNSADTDQFALRRYELRISTADLARLQNGELSNETYPATLVGGGKTYSGVKVRIRGSWSRSWPKKSLKIFFDRTAQFEGRHVLDLNSGWHDPAFIREPLAYYVYGICGVRAPMTRLVRLDINGHFGGLYVEVEQPNKDFLKRVDLAGASIYKAMSRSNDADERDVGSEEAFRARYSKETHHTEGYGDLQEFCHGLRIATNAPEFFEKHVDVDAYINYLAGTVLVQNWDGFNKNHFLVHDERSHKWTAIPWDLDRTFGDHWNGSFSQSRLPVMLGTRNLPGVTGWNRMEDRFFNEATLRNRFVSRLSVLLETEFTEEKLFPVIDRIQTAILADVQKDREQWPRPGQDVLWGIQQVKTFIKARRAFLQSEVNRMRRGQLANASQ